MQSAKAANMWKKHLSLFTEEELVINSAIKLSRVLNDDRQPDEAKETLISHINTVSSLSKKAELFDSLSIIEKSLGNKRLASYCKDKSIELQPNDRDELFNAAYESSNQGVEDLAVSNYITLLKLDEGYSMGLNNLGVITKDAGLKIKSVENYKKAANQGNTLAMSNQGYLLLDAGFIKEAKELADKAISSGAPHKNVYSLQSRIKELQEREDSEWNKLSERSLEQQKFIRLFTSAYYEEGDFSIEGEWKTNTGQVVNFSICNRDLNISWQESRGIAGDVYHTKISGTLHNAAFSGSYEFSKKVESEATTLLDTTLNKNITCFGFFSDEGRCLNIASEDSSKELKIKLLR